MRGEIVALDLETTGLNRDEDDIIEIGAALFENGELRETFSTLVNPGRPIPDRITAITGIETDDLIGQPGIRSVAGPAGVYWDRPVLGHRVDFDLAFWHAMVATHNMPLDTYELASVLLPDTARYNLTHLTDQLDVNLEHAHRALDDALATGHLYWERGSGRWTCRWICRRSSRRGRPAMWSAAPVFQAALGAQQDGVHRGSARQAAQP